MGDVIYINPGDSDPFADIEARLRDALDQYGDGDSAQWVVEMIHRLCNIPELTFDFSVQFPGDIGEPNAIEIGDRMTASIKDRVEQIKYGMVNAFVKGYFEKKRKEYLGT